MQESPPSGPATVQRQFAKLTKYARRHVLVALGLSLVVTAAGLFVSLAIPAVYESSVTLDVREPGVAAPDLESKLRAAARNPNHMKDLAAATAGGVALGEDTLRRFTEAIGVVHVAGDRFFVSFNAGSAAAAHDGADMVAHNVMTDLLGADKGSQAHAESERRAQALAAFVTAHPTVVGEQGAKPTEKSRPAQSVIDSAVARDQTLIVLRQEKKRLEAELAASEAAAPAPSAGFGPNPYEDGANQSAAGLRQRIADLRTAIVLRSRAVAEEKSASSSTPIVTPSTNDQSLKDEWRRLVQAVMDAEKASAADPSSSQRLSVKIVEAATFPRSPLRPNRWVLGVFSVLLGAVAGVGWAFWRASMDLARRARHALAKSNVPSKPPEASAPRSPTPAPPGEPSIATDASKALATRTVPIHAVQKPAPFLATQRGVVDVRAVLAQTGKAPTTLKPQMTVGITSAGAEKVVPPLEVPTRRSDPPKREPPASPVPQRPPSDPPRSPLPPRPRMDSPRTSSSVPPRPKMDSQRTSSSVPPRPKMDSQRGSPLPPRPRMDSPRTSSSSPPRPDPEPARPSTAPRAEASGRERHRDVAFDTTLPTPPPRARQTISPPPMGSDAVRAVPAQPADRAGSIRPPPPDDLPADTKRIGSPVAPTRPSSAPPRDSRPRFDTTYRIVDRSIRPSSRPPHVERDNKEWHMSPRATQPLHTPSNMVKPITRVSERPRTVPPPAEEPTAPLRPSPIPFDRHPADPLPDAQARTQTAMVRVGGGMPMHDDIVAPRSAPPSWRPPVEVSSTASAQELLQLRDQLLQLRGGRCFVVGVTGNKDAGDAKTIAAARLSTLLAETSRVLLMEANFDWPAVHRILSLHMPPAAGFSQQMHARIRSAERSPWIVVRCSESLHVLAEGVIRSPGILFSQEFAVAVSELRQCYDFIVADGPIGGVESDYKPINALTDGIVVTVRPGGKLSDALDDASRLFTRKELTAAVYGDTAQRA